MTNRMSRCCFGNSSGVKCARGITRSTSPCPARPHSKKLAGRVGGEIGLLVSDINMPGMNGLDLLPAVKERRPDLPVFMISAYGDAGRVVTALARGADQFLAKPVDFPKLKQDIKAVMAGPRGNG